ncbi:MAG: tRNA preQ1(34) S-adenosylmethionine ribosyltransferase-isomerase QueA [Methanobacteriota archaeon]|nr:MAG: tRNA preQ1(34) S-adenosylmethionine ribosyltransferase-isomerase QueA [Euryarchaeota archaeon]
MKLSEFDFNLPKELIAQSPTKPRDASRLMVLKDEENLDKSFSDLVEYVEEGDVLVINDSKVIPARIHGRKSTGGRIEILLVKEIQKSMWECLLKGRVREGTELQFGTEDAIVYEKKDGKCVIAFNVDDFESFLRREGTMPVPPYIKEEIADATEYQTIYADKDGSVAAPTAGLHFTEEMLAKIQGKGAKLAPITLHVSPGTFMPIRTENVEEHRMEDEYVYVSGETAGMIEQARLAGKKVIAVGTTSLKALESASREGMSQGYEGWSDLFIYPPFEFKSGVDALVTNFHLPGSTLLLLVSALVGRERLLAAYEEAVRLRYRFYSFGDAMLIFR